MLRRDMQWVTGGVAAAVGITSFAGPALAAELILHHVNEMHLLDANRITYDAVVGGEPVQVVLSRRGDGEGRVLVADATENNRSLGHVEFQLENFPDLDFNAAKVFAEREGDGTKVLVEMRYGDGRDCYVNDPGRDRLSIMFSAGKSQAYVITYEDCKVAVRDLPLD